MASRQQLPEAAVSAQPAQLQAAPAAPPPPRLPPLAVVQHASSEPSTPLAGMAGAANGVGTSPKSKTAASLDCGGSAATPMSRQGSGFPDILFRPGAGGPEQLQGGRFRQPCILYCCNCSYRGPSQTRAQCGLARTLWVLLTLGLGLGCRRAGADIAHYCPSCHARVATCKYL